MGSANKEMIIEGTNTKMPAILPYTNQLTVFVVKVIGGQ